MPKLINLTGKRFERLTVIERAPNKGTVTRWKCKCDCGKEIIVRAADLRTGRTRSCGCLRSEVVSKRMKEDIPIGTKFTYLTVLARLPKENKNHQNLYKCQCICGNTCIVPGTHLKTSKTKDCGCGISKEAKNNTNILLHSDEIPIGKAENLKGKQFGYLTVLYRVNRPKNVVSGTYWKCQCVCGNTIITRSNNLKSGKTKSCGCIVPNTSKTDALINKRFGFLTVIEKTPKSNTKKEITLYKCKCDCGNIITASYTDLHNNKIQSCGCKTDNLQLKTDEIPVGQAQDLRNKIFGRLTVLYRVDPPTLQKNRGIVFWKCRCECGENVIVRANDLTSGKIVSCGCYREEQLKKVKEKPLQTGERFGRLTIIKRVENNCFNQSQYLCQCDCGNTTITTRQSLVKGTTKSCGCLKSLGEEIITKILIEHKISFIKEYSFDDCCGDSAPLRFDFYVNDKYLIEYDGRQHFYAVNAWGGEKQFKITQKYDNIKNEYCKTHNIPLIRIPYTHCDKITIEDLIPETSQFLIT